MITRKAEHAALLTMVVNVSQSITVDWIKMELGNFATQYVSKEYGTELTECMRYYQKIALSVGQDRSNYKYIPTLLPMRTTPTHSLQQIAAIGTPKITATPLYITANLAAPQYFDGIVALSADL